MKLDNVNIDNQEILITPEELKRQLPATEEVKRGISQNREIVRSIIDGTDKRLLLVVGPCSIHNPQEAIDYAERLKALSESVNDKLFIVMRAYFEKPRSTVGWKGLINDPHLDDSFKIAEGLAMARKLLLEISKLGLPLANEALDPITPQYLQELFSWTAIGARTSESQTHREMASGLSCPVGFKNGTDGSLDVALNALQSVKSPHRFLGISPDGKVSIVTTKGNAHAHVVLRGGTNGPNYYPENIAVCEEELESIGATQAIMVDCSHANSNKDHTKQGSVLEAVAEQISVGNKSIRGVMLESNLNPGNQKVDSSQELQYGVSITDACIGWEETERLLRDFHKALP
jgi:3-deoxy-7-phosphoheptulonate synthase